jgi:DNA adenine methylase Dam
MGKFQNPIKYSGSKSPLASQIITYFPNTDENYTFYEVFCGSCAVTLELLSNNNYTGKRNYHHFVCVDNNKDLINLWQHIKSSPHTLFLGYEYLWHNFNHKESEIFPVNSEKLPQHNPSTPIEGHRKEFFNFIREEFNKGKHTDLTNAILFFTLSRISFNGLIRYNSNGVYNSSCHFSRPGIDPVKLKTIIHNTSELLNRYNVKFICDDYRNIKPSNPNDFVFMDPPYSSVSEKAGQKSMYHGGINTEELIDYCNNLPCKYALTFDGDRGENKAKRICLTDTKTVLLTGKNSSYSRLKGNQINVEEIMYMKQ